MKGGEIKIKYANGGRRVENEISDNYQFVLLARASHFRYVRNTISIPEDLGHRCDWRTCHSRCGILDVSRKFHRKILGCTRLLILTDSSQRSFSRFWSLFLEHSEVGPHTLLNGGLRRIPITLIWECCRDLLNLHLQHLIEV
jgi:hypothetical protein